MNLIEIHIILPINHWNQNIRPGNLGSAARLGSGFYTPPQMYGNMDEKLAKVRVTAVSYLASSCMA